MNAIQLNVPELFQIPYHIPLPYHITAPVFSCLTAYQICDIHLTVKKADEFRRAIEREGIFSRVSVTVETILQ